MCIPLGESTALIRHPDRQWHSARTEGPNNTDNSRDSPKDCTFLAPSHVHNHLRFALLKIKKNKRCMMIARSWYCQTTMSQTQR
jgi:hypothetical protein